MKFLHDAQMGHGEWRTDASPDESLAVNPRLDSSPFCTSLIIHCIRRVQGPRADECRDAAAAFLLDQMQAGGLWTYWTSYHPRHTEAPPDLDSTSCASWALRSLGREFPSSAALFLDHRTPEGLFYTWLIPRAESSDALKRAVREVWKPRLADTMLSLRLRDIVDMGVLANALLFIGQDDPRTEASIAALSNWIENGREIEQCDYYTSRAILWYFVTRTARGGITKLEPAVSIIVERIRQIEPAAVSVQDLALHCCTLLDAGNDTISEAWIARLLDAQGPCGAWAAEAAWILGDREVGTGLYYGSAEMTTGFCLEAITGWIAANERSRGVARLS